MDYEELLSSAEELALPLRNSLNQQNKAQKSMTKAMAQGDLKSWLRDIAAWESALEESAAGLARIRELTERFDAAAYLEGGEFAAQFLGYCEAIGLDVKGEFPVYEVFPYRVRADMESLELYVDRKKAPCLRPKRFAEDLKASRDKLMKASFNAAAFAGELAEAYDIALLRQSGGKSYVVDADCYLAGMYKFLAPTARARREYDKQSYAFDLARLYSSDVETIRDGRRFQFGPARDNSKAIRVLDGDGKEQFLATIRFF